MKATQQHIHWNDVLDAQPQQQAFPMVANDTLYKELEMRYGGGFAQWIIDDLNRTKRAN